MFVYFVPLTIFLFHQVVTQVTLCPGTWSEWTPASGATCNDPEAASPCGMCGQIQVERSCQPSVCQCEDPTNTTMMAPCGEVVCLYPRRSCCSPYTKKVIPGGGLICDLPPPDFTTTTATP